MKNLYSLIFVGLLMASCVPEYDSTESTSSEKAASVLVQANAAYIKNISEGVKLPVALLGESKAEDISNVKLMVEYVPAGTTPSPDENEVLLIEITSLPDSVDISDEKLLELADAESLDDLSAGDRWIIRYKVAQKNGRVLTHGVNTTINFTCQSDLAGTYMNTTEVSVSDFGPQSFAYEVELVALGGGNYTVEDMTGGLWSRAPYSTEYGSTARVTQLSDICGTISLANVSDQFGGEVTTAGQPAPTYDPVTGVITWSWTATGYGETGVTTYTPVE